MKKVFLLLSLLLINSAYAENWINVYKAKYSFDVDSSRIVRTGDKAKFYIAERDGPKNMFFQVETNCKTRQFRTLSIGNDPKASMSLLSDPNGGWESPKKEDKIAVINYVCGGPKK